MKGTKKDWSGWYGPSGRYISEYDIPKITSSQAFLALKAMGTRNLPSAQKMTQIRRAATIQCPTQRVSIDCNVTQGCLFDISLDPCEQFNLAFTHPGIVKRLKGELEKLKATAVKPTNGPKDPRANPKYWGYIWTHWKDLLGKTEMWLLLVTLALMHSIKHVPRFYDDKNCNFMLLSQRVAIALLTLLCRNSQKNRSRKLFPTVWVQTFRVLFCCTV